MKLLGLSQLYGHLTRPRRMQRLHSAYVAVFRGQGKREDAEIVLSDLADYSGFFKTGDELSADDLFRMDGRRDAYRRIFTFLAMTPGEVEELAEAARADDLQKSEDEGDYLD